MAPSAATAPPSTLATTKRTTSSDRAGGQRVEDAEVKPYIIVSDLGKGSFATVYRGYHEVRMFSSCYTTAGLEHPV